MKYGDDAPIPDPYLHPAQDPRTNEGGQAGDPDDTTRAPPPSAGPPQRPAGQQEPANSPTYALGSSTTAPQVWPEQPRPFHPGPTSAYATWALVVGVFGLICFGAGPILGALAMLLGVLGWREVGRSGGRLRGRLAAGAGFVVGVVAIALFVGEVALYLTFVGRKPLLANAPPGAQESASAVSSSTDEETTGSTPGTTPSDPPSTTSTVTNVGSITVVDVALGVSSLSSELRRQHAEATAHGERLLLETTSPACTQCQGVATSLSDPRMQRALEHVRLVRVDRDPFEEDLAELEIPTRPYPGFFLLDSDLRVTDAIHGGEWDDDVAMNIAPVLGPFVRGNYVKRRSPWKKLPRPGGTVL